MRSLFGLRQSATHEVLGLIVVLTALGAALAVTWRRWVDPVIDFGLQVFVAQQLALGKRLWVDVSYHVGGPLSPYINALWLHLFGPFLTTFFFANITIMVVLVVLLYRLTRAISDSLAATAAGLAFVGLFAVAQHGSASMFNYVSPYSHDLIHGMLLGLCAVWLLWRGFNSGRRVWILAAGFAAGLTLLTKPEASLATLCACCVGLGLAGCADRDTKNSAARALCFGLMVPVPASLAVALLATTMPAEAAVAGVLRAWMLVLEGNAFTLHYFRWGLGIDQPLQRMGAIAAGSFAYAAFAWALVRLSQSVQARSRRILLDLGLLLAAGAAIWRLWEELGWDRFWSPLPVVTAVIGFQAAWGVWRNRKLGVGATRQGILTTMLASFAFVLLLKILLNARLYHYGFALAMPATLLSIVAAMSSLPRLASRRGGAAWVVRGVVMAAVFGSVALSVRQTMAWMDTKKFTVGHGRNAFLTDRRGEILQRALDGIERLSKPGETMLVVPEGALLGFLSGRGGSTPFYNTTPFELDYLYGEIEVLDALRAVPPDLVAVVHRPTSDYGVRFFGREYGEVVWRWIQSNYQRVALFGAPPLEDERFGVALLRRVDRLAPDEPSPELPIVRRP